MRTQKNEKTWSQRLAEDPEVKELENMSSNEQVKEAVKFGVVLASMILPIKLIHSLSK
jgi:hypothetical protein